MNERRVESKGRRGMEGRREWMREGLREGGVWMHGESM